MAGAFEQNSAEERGIEMKDGQAVWVRVKKVFNNQGHLVDTIRTETPVGEVRKGAKKTK